MTDNQDSGVTMDKQVPPTDRPLTAGDWIEWHGGENPVGNAVVDVQYRDYPDVTDRVISERVQFPNDGAWYHHGHPSDIIAYRLARPATSAASEGEGIERAIDGETVLGFKVAAWRFDTKCPQDQDKEKWDSFFGKSGPPHTYCEHWSTPGAGASNVERLFTEAQLRAALASPPVSERERELEGALRYVVGLLPGLAGAQNQPDNAVYTVMAAKSEIMEARRLRDTLTVQPVGEGK